MSAVKWILRALLVLCAAFFVYVLGFLPYNAVIMIPPLAPGGLSVAVLTAVAILLTALTVINRCERPEKPKYRRLLRTAATVLADAMLLFFALISGWLFGGTLVNKTVKSPDGVHDVVCITDSDVIGNTFYKFYVKTSGIKYTYLFNNKTDSPPIEWEEDGVMIGEILYSYS